MALVCCVDESAPYEKNVGIPHMVGSEHELRGWLGIQSLRCVREKNCLSCLHRHVHVWIVDCFISFPYAANCWFRYDDQSADCIVVIFAFLRDVWPGEGGLYRWIPATAYQCFQSISVHAARCWSCLARHTWRDCGACGRSSPCSLWNKELLTGEQIAIVCMDYSTGLNFSYVIKQFDTIYQRILNNIIAVKSQ